MRSIREVEFRGEIPLWGLAFACSQANQGGMVQSISKKVLEEHFQCTSSANAAALRELRGGLDDDPRRTCK